jgi:NADH-quinone oxidoreductase subunit N
MLVLARSANLAALFLGIEILSLALYVLVAFRYANRVSIRGGVLYLILASFASAFLALGVAFIYAAYGTLEIGKIAEFKEAPSLLSFLGHVGVGLFLVGAGFKLAVVPFHMWAPDVYEAAPSIISGVIASASKGATLAALVPLAFLFVPHTSTLYLIILGTVVGGNLLGLLEQRPKRILAYSSIAHVGYLLTGYLAFVSAAHDSALSAQLLQALFFYIVGYSLAALGAFAVLSQFEDGRPIYLRDLRGLLKRHPLAAWLLMVFIVSLAGIPPTIGFLSKFYLFLTAVKAGYLWLVVWALVGTAIGVFYYTRILAQLFMSASEGVEIKVQHDQLRDVVLTLTAGLTILWGITPHFLLSYL